MGERNKKTGRDEYANLLESAIEESQDYTEIGLDRRTFLKQAGTGMGIAVAGEAAADTGTKHKLRHLLADTLPAVLPEQMYTSYTLDKAEFVGQMMGSVDEVENYLQQAGYEYQMLGAKKLHPDTERADDGSYRRIDPEDTAKQWHVHLWETDDGVDVFSHYEYVPEPFPWDEQRVAEHYRPEHGKTYLPGQHSEDVKYLLEEHGEYHGTTSLLGSADLEPPTGDISDIFS